MSTADGPVTLVTGGGSGIGAAAARLLLGRGHRVAVTGRSAERLEGFAAETAAGDALLAVPGDTSEPGAVAAAVDAAVRRFGRLDHVVANAGYSTHDTLADGDPGEWRAMLLTNVLGPALLIRAALPALRGTRGRVVLVGSVAGIKSTPGSMYSVTKTAVTGLAENARVLLTGSGVGVTLVAPGRVESPFWDSRENGMPEGPALTSEQVAESIAWVLAQPAGVEINSVVVRPSGQVR
ncbi:SDR family NAD(P)-dependent oxidoreductase [Actinomadura darangshiensis]|uniref:SDR family NAD(P)-dependent oxidoreductase n=1 Tax=Actinomadura darangshiensis TaxID=705336 RepID=A0A4R4ZVY2_9ACTN|nr:SDR family NAD(P)-dependent oxidoreductase [Actinomadura darangshiensis]TDD63351.1 SDR family NAD(P)-dependent oxidoreductase [Actinomadura darangshiensis]